MARTAWIIGGGSGIGAAVARQLAAAGWTVAVSGRRADRLAELAEAMLNIRPYPLDVGDGVAVFATVARIVEDLGRIDLVLYGAIAPVRMPVGHYDAEDFRRAYDTNILGFVRVVEAVAGPMMAQGGGQIAAIASLAGYFGSPGAAAYASSKAALISLCETMHTELAPGKLDVRLVAPGFVRTELTARNKSPMPFLIDPDEAARAIVHGLTRSRRFEIAFPWRPVWMMKAIRALPYPLFFLLMRRMMPKGKR